MSSWWLGYHDFDDDTGRVDYGTEWNFLVAKKIRQTLFTAWLNTLTMMPKLSKPTRKKFGYGPEFHSSLVGFRFANPTKLTQEIHIVRMTSFA